VNTLIITGGILLLLIAASTHRKVVKVLMTQAELAQALADFQASQSQAQTDLSAQLNKALAEIIAAVQNAGNVTPELQAAVDNMRSAIAAGDASAKAVAQQLDDLNPDTP
jgi:uncharacterized hydantoinase/oxoprolinase family protein